MGKVELVPVILGRDYGTEVEVRSRVRPDDRVIMNPAGSLTFGVAVWPVPADCAAKVKRQRSGRPSRIASRNDMLSRRVSA